MDRPLVSSGQAMRPSGRLVPTAAAPKVPASTALPASAGKDGSGTDFSFGDVLSALNPLQYLPVVGSIYRAVTGDTIPETLRTIGSLAVSGIIGGPIGLAISAATTLFEKVSGIETDDIVHQALAAVGLASEKPKAALAAGGPAFTPVSAATAVPWTRAQRKAYHMTAVGPAVSGRVGLEARLGQAANEQARRQATAAAYARNWLASADAPRRSAYRVSA